MAGWRSLLPYDPVPPLLASGDPAIAFCTARELVGRTDGEVSALWDVPAAQRIVRQQRADGAWTYPGGNPRLRSAAHYDQLETFRQLGYLVELYGLTTAHPAIGKAADFLFGCQTDTGDIRGILGTQYTPYYTAAMLELLIKAGYADDRRVARAFSWLSSMRQDDGGWALPLRTRKQTLAVIAENVPTLEPDRSRPFSHLVTGVVLRAYAAHPDYRRTAEAHVAGQLLLSHLFKKDNYPDRSGPEYWLRFTYPFWFTDLLSATDSLSKLGFPKEAPGLARAIAWFTAHQDASGLWRLKTLKNQTKYQTDLWLSLAICRVLQRLHADA